jgi:RNA-directed DNA polymerase
MLADEKASKGKRKQKEIRLHNANREANIAQIQEELVSKRYKTSPYKVFKIYEPKERDISKLPYRDRIVQHAIMNPLEAVMVPMFTADTYSAIKKRGVHKAANALKRALKDKAGTMYCLKIDIRKFYPNVNHEVLKRQLRRKIKDNDLLWLLDGIIDSAPGLPIGNYLSQYLANFYLTGFDHWIKEQKKVKYYFRYADDMVVLADSKKYLHQLLADIREYLDVQLKLVLKGNYQVFPVAARGIDVIGYVFYHTHTLIRKSIKRRCLRMLKKKRNPASIASYNGWMQWADCKNLQKKHNMRTFKELNIASGEKGMMGDKIKMERVFNREISVHSYKVGPSKIKDKGSGQCLQMQICIGETMHVLFTGSLHLIDLIERVPKEAFPFKTIIIKDNDRFLFT